VSGTADGQEFCQPLDKSEENGLDKANFNSPPKSPLPRWEGIHPVKYELFDVIHLESMQQDVEHGCLSLSFNRVKGRGTEHFAHPHLHPPPSRGGGKSLGRKINFYRLELFSYLR